MTEKLPLIFLWIVVFCILLPRRKHSRRRRIHRNKERIQAMNELIASFVGKRCQISGDLYITKLATVKEVKDGWVLVEDDKGKQTMFNLAYISQIEECPEKKKNK